MTALAIETLDVADVSSRTEGSCRRVQACLARAFGPGGPGILCVSRLPAWYPAERASLLASARAFASLPTERRSRYELAHLDFSVGWSCGREQFKGRVDDMKGSYYGNPVFDDPSQGNHESARRYKHLLAPNVWPRAEGHANMELPFKRIGSLIDELGRNLAWHCDRYVESVVGGGTVFTKLHDSLSRSRAQKGRLLHYYPPLSRQDKSSGPLAPRSDNGNLWCGFHNDHGTLTGLVAGQFYDEVDNATLASSPDPSAGLFVSPGGADCGLSRVTFPADSIAFQTGEAAQIVSGGILCATSHAVRMVPMHCAEEQKISRSTMAVFLQPQPDEALDLPPWDADGCAALSTSKLVPPLRTRYCPNDSFASFGAKTIAAYVVGDDCSSTEHTVVN